MSATPLTGVAELAVAMIGGPRHATVVTSHRAVRSNDARRTVRRGPSQPSGHRLSVCPGPASRGTASQWRGALLI